MFGLLSWKVLIVGAAVVGGSAGAVFIVANSGPLVDRDPPAFTVDESQPIPSPTPRPTPTTPPTPALPNLEEFDGVPIQTLQLGSPLPASEYAVIAYTRDCFACGDVVGQIERAHEGLDGVIQHEVLLADVIYPGVRPSTDISPNSFEVRHCDAGDCNDGDAPGSQVVVSTLRTTDLGVSFEVLDTVSSLDRDAVNDHITTNDPSKSGTLTLVTGVRISVSDDGERLVGDDGIVYYDLPSAQLVIAYVRRVPDSDLLYMLLADTQIQAYLYQALLEPFGSDRFRVVWAATAQPGSENGPRLDLAGGVSQLVDGRYAVMTEEMSSGARPVMVDLQTGSVQALAVAELMGPATVAVHVVPGPVVRVASSDACVEAHAEPAETAAVVDCVEAGTLLKLDRTSSPAAGWVPVEIEGRIGWIEKGSVR